MLAVVNIKELTDNISPYIKEAMTNRELVITEGPLARTKIASHFDIVAKQAKLGSIERHRNMIQSNINRYGKLKVLR